MLRTVKEISRGIAIVNTLKVTMTGFNGTLEILTRRRKRKRRMRTSLLILLLLSLNLQGAILKPLTKRAVNEQLDNVILAEINVDGYTLAKLIEHAHKFNPRINYITYFPSTVVAKQVPVNPVLPVNPVGPVEPLAPTPPEPPVPPTPPEPPG